MAEKLCRRPTEILAGGWRVAGRMAGRVAGFNKSYNFLLISKLQCVMEEKELTIHFSML